MQSCDKKKLTALNSYKKFKLILLNLIQNFDTRCRFNSYLCLLFIQKRLRLQQKI